jgi:hypothetical protein
VCLHKRDTARGVYAKRGILQFPRDSLKGMGSFLVQIPLSSHEAICLDTIINERKGKNAYHAANDNDED